MLGAEYEREEGGLGIGMGLGLGLGGMEGGEREGHMRGLSGDSEPNPEYTPR
jgi:hypothetical protein